VAAVVGLGDAHRSFLTHVLRLLGARRAYALMGGLARRFYDAADDVRQSSEARCREALGGHRPEASIQEISRAAFVHRIWNLTDLMLAPRLLRPETFERCGCRIPEPYRRLLLEAQERGRPVILVTTYYGPYDLLPVVLGLNGLRAMAVYRPHPNRRYDRYRQAVRTSTGCDMVTQSGAATGVAEALESGRTVALLIDPADAGKGVPVSFMGASLTVPRTVGLLAEHYGAIIAVAAIRRGPKPFTFQLVVSDFFGPGDWSDQPDGIAYCTRRYCAAIESLVLEVPEQYLWLRHGSTTAGPGDPRRGGRESGSTGHDGPAGKVLVNRKE
jgi:KDO2-lipid IV(A) lauroyltransferase